MDALQKKMHCLALISRAAKEEATLPTEVAIEVGLCIAGYHADFIIRASKDELLNKLSLGRLLYNILTPAMIEKQEFINWMEFVDRNADIIIANENCLKVPISVWGEVLANTGFSTLSILEKDNNRLLEQVRKNSQINPDELLVTNINQIIPMLANVPLPDELREVYQKDFSKESIDKQLKDAGVSNDSVEKLVTNIFSNQSVPNDIKNEIKEIVPLPDGSGFMIMGSVKSNVPIDSVPDLIVKEIGDQIGKILQELKSNNLQPEPKDKAESKPPILKTPPGNILNN